MVNPIPILQITFIFIFEHSVLDLCERMSHVNDSWLKVPSTHQQDYCLHCSKICLGSSRSTLCFYKTSFLSPDIRTYAPSKRVEDTSFPLKSVNQQLHIPRRLISYSQGAIHTLLALKFPINLLRRTPILVLSWSTQQYRIFNAPTHHSLTHAAFVPDI